MRLKSGLRLRVALSLMLLSMLLMVSQTLAVFIVAEEQEEEFIDRVVAEEMQTLVEGYRRNPEFVPPQHGIFSGYIVREGASHANLPEYLRALQVGNHEIFVDDKEFHVQLRKERDANFYLIYDATPHEKRIDEFRAFLLLIMLIDAVVTAVLGFWLSGVLVHQVTDLASRVAKLNPGAEKRPLAEAYRDEEVIMLASAFDHYQQRVAQLIQREKEFTANVSHELRTPLTSIKTGCELLLHDVKLAGKSRKRIEAISDAADRIAESMRALLFLAREIPAGDDEPVSVAEALHEAMQPFRETLAAKGVRLLIQAAPDAVVRTNRAALMLALSNLIKNAVVYTDAGKITLEYGEHTFFVRDTGCGISRDDLPYIFERGYRANTHRGEGSGLGLAIVKRIADQFGWRVSAASDLHNGSTFAITFPEESTRRT